MKLYEDIGYLENEKEVAFPREVSTIKLSYFILDNSHDKEVSWTKQSKERKKFCFTDFYGIAIFYKFYELLSI